ncbi:MAG TPA: hypothetical protein VJT31_08070, partial [Rugosimonospora sp.]|nr:hypothetical protein [Rugosimonospora sp.]
GGSGIGSAIMAAAALAGGVLLRLLLPPLSVASSRIVQERALRRLRATVFEAAREYVVEPVRGLLGKYARASAALAAAGSVGINDTDNSNDQRRADRARAAGSGVGAGHP